MGFAAGKMATLRGTRVERHFYPPAPGEETHENRKRCKRLPPALLPAGSPDGKAAGVLGGTPEESSVAGTAASQRDCRGAPSRNARRGLLRAQDLGPGERGL